MPASPPAMYPYPFNVVADALPRILPSCGFTIVSQDWPNGMLKVRGSGTIMAAGENLTIRVGTNHPNYTSVQVDSGVRLGVLTYARTSSNFDTILKTLGTYLDSYYAEHRAPDAPPIYRPPPPAPAPPSAQGYPTDPGAAPQQ
jgi:hypothetical protein